MTMRRELKQLKKRIKVLENRTSILVHLASWGDETLKDSINKKIQQMNKEAGL